MTPADDSLLAQGTIDFRSEGRRSASMTEANANTRRNAFDHTDCGNGPDEEGNWPCDPKALFGTALAECQVCGRVASRAEDSQDQPQ